MPLPIAVEVTPADAPREHVAVLLAACGRASADTECVPAADVPANGSSAVALVTWSDAAHVVIEVGVRKEGRPEWRSKKLEFRSSDAELERWRAIGFVVGVLSRDETTLPAPSEPSPSGPSPSEPSSSAPSSSAPSSSAPSPSGSSVNGASSSVPSGSSPKEPAASAPVKPPESTPKAAENSASSPERERPRRARPGRREGPEPPQRPTITLVEEDSSERTRSPRFGLPGGTLDVGAALGPALEDGIRFGGFVRAGIRVAGPLRAVLAGRYLDRPMGAERLGGRWISGAAGLGIDVLNQPLSLMVTLDARGEYFEARAELGDLAGSAGAFLPGVGLGLNTAWMATRGFGLFLGIDASAMLRGKRIELRKGEEIATDSALNFNGEAGFRLRLW